MGFPSAFAASNQEVAMLLRANGYERLPGWLQSAEEPAPDW